MSYILDALRKLEETRRWETVPDILAPLQISTRPKRKQPVIVYLLLAALLLNAAIFLWWLQSFHSSNITVSAETLEKKISENIPPAPDEKVSGSRSRQSDVFAAVTTRKSAGTLEGRIKAGPSTSSDSRQTDTASETKKREPEGNKSSEALKRELPDLTISGHYYDSDPAKRVAVINGKTLHEGQNVTEGLRVEQITSLGVVFSYRGVSFTKGVF